MNNSPTCVTARIVDLPRQASDYIPVCRDADGAAVPDSLAEDGTPTCAPFPPGRMPADWRQTTLPSGGAIAMNPVQEGLTGLDSWFWYVGPTTHRWQSPVFEGRTADCRVIPAPPPTTYTAFIGTYRWAFQDSRPADLVATGPGWESAPAATHRYRSKGNWEVRVACTWRGSPPADLDMPCARRSVPVTSVRATLTD